MRARHIQAQVLQLVRTNPMGIAVADCAYATGKPTSQIRSILGRLRERGYVHPSKIKLPQQAAKLWKPGPTSEIRIAQIIEALQTSLTQHSLRIGRIMEAREHVRQISECLVLLEELSRLRLPDTGLQESRK